MNYVHEIPPSASETLDENVVDPQSKIDPDLLEKLLDIDRWDIVGFDVPEDTNPLPPLISRDTPSVSNPIDFQPDITSYSKTYTPKINWFQTDHLIKLDIELPVDDPVIKVLRHSVFTFK